MVFKNFIPLGNISKGIDESLDNLNPENNPLKLCLEIESPPCVLYGAATDSSGAILNGILKLKVRDPYYDFSLAQDSVSPVQSNIGSRLSTTLTTTFSNLALSSNELSPNPSSNTNVQLLSGYTKIAVDSVTLKLIQIVHFHKTFVPDTQAIQTCKNCTTKTTKIKNWDIQKNTVEMSVGSYVFPFSCLIPGSVPATTTLGSTAETEIKYELIATVKYKDPRRDLPTFGKVQSLKLSMPIAVTRSILRGPDKNSLRVFPPTELTATAVLPNVVYPKSSFPLEMKIDGISSGDRRWRMRKLNWRIEETTRIRSYACDSHKHDLKQKEEEVKQKEEERSKKPQVPIKRYGDIGPQIKVAVGTPDNTPIRRRHRNNVTSQPVNQNAETEASQTRRQIQGDQDDDDDDNTTEFVHPSDHALRQEIEQQQERVREKQIEQELKNDTTLFTEEVRIVSRGEMKNGWKTDFENNGHVELVTDIDCMSLDSGVSNPVKYVSTMKQREIQSKHVGNIACDMQDPVLGIYVNHMLAVEIVVAEEMLQYANGQPLRSSKKSDTSSSTNVNHTDQRLAELSPMFANRNSQKSQPVNEEDISPVDSGSSIGSGVRLRSNSPGMKIVSIPTGAARVLRMQFKITLTERSGLGISWDDEVPPIYQDIKTLSPPTYYEITTLTTNNGNSKNGYDAPSYVIPEVRIESPSSVAQMIKPPPQARHHNSPYRNNNNSQPPAFSAVVRESTPPIPYSTN
ncbi:hypothetical protein Kpol_316p7 [Vanderwaltozyma polyspora DSM 70294]|uniref:LDB19 N-terminal domain-containing protein n=1 Tax=Vanderwaltozyma polyspora (strain ATCC 22028 / DSM 70294 / BCRC 21397 / CBS 2163 / NBRC 10782 / NRRL Y-8283 / UCD 57-17) TaxID=436907 RepID=A7TSP7_VANPO|nr:uncharacterized protein Kpol_316p7 [Vanderwaltozyma polyspora DSM 70294]EDO14714.1 hypothetical protein Kpol_316p7 [Vanderwaltozyma polyspora DSM 70294]